MSSNFRRGQNGTKAGGLSSIAMGQNSIAFGDNSIAMGINSNSSGGFSTAIGSYTTSSGSFSTALGYYTVASGGFSTAMGVNTTASGGFSTAMGFNTKSKSYGGLSIGFYNDSTNAAGATGFNPLNRIFQIGNGTADNARSNALTVLQNGKIGIGLTSPVTLLDVNGDASFNDKTILLRNGADLNHGLRFDGNVNGPYLFGFNGGALGTSGLPNSLTWDWNGNVSVRNNFTVQNGKVGIGLTSPISLLDVNGNASFNDKTILLRTGTDLNHGIRYDATVDGPYIFGFNGGALGASGYPNALNWTWDGKVNILNSLTVQNGKGIIRSTDGTQKKQLSTNVLVNTSLAAGATTSINFTFSESFSSAPDVYVGNVISGTGGWAEVIMTIGNVSTTGGKLYVNNSTAGTWNPNFTVKVIAIGPQ